MHAYISFRTLPFALHSILIVLPKAQVQIKECLLRTVDGKGLESMHFQSGLRCWTCSSRFDDVAALRLVDTVPTHVRYGAFLASIPVDRRTGDYVHCTSRIVNAIFKRLAGWAATAGSAASSQLSAFVRNVIDEAAHVPHR